MVQTSAARGSFTLAFTVLTVPLLVSEKRVEHKNPFGKNDPSLHREPGVRACPQRRERVDCALLDDGLLSCARVAISCGDAGATVAQSQRMR